jgi:nitroreductase
MEFDQVVRKRRMTRNYSAEPVPAEVLERMLDLARRGPSAGYTQGLNFVVVTRPELRQAIAKVSGEEGYVAGGFDPFISWAPVLVVACTSEAAYHRRYQEPDKIAEDGTEIEWTVPYWYMDIGCAVMILLLAAVDEGLAAGFVGVTNMQGLRELLGIPEEVIPVGVVTIGYPAADVPSPSLKRGRKPIEEFAHRETW